MELCHATHQQWDVEGIPAFLERLITNTAAMWLDPALNAWPHHKFGRLVTLGPRTGLARDTEVLAAGRHRLTIHEPGDKSRALVDSVTLLPRHASLL